MNNPEVSKTSLKLIDIAHSVKYCLYCCLVGHVAVVLITSTSIVAQVLLFVRFVILGQKILVLPCTCCTAYQTRVRVTAALDITIKNCLISRQATNSYRI